MMHSTQLRLTRRSRRRSATAMRPVLTMNGADLARVNARRARFGVVAGRGASCTTKAVGWLGDQAMSDRDTREGAQGNI
ncbi:hypothetical protein GCM10010199_08570 [Dactylosporangium roseum]